ncbi:MAG: 6-phosphogluconolactonase [Melioribacter sp.]|nr:6-phosphogluconolactonase [Melioribacter sp.]
MKEIKIVVFNDISSIAQKAIEYLSKKINSMQQNDFFTIALSGGSTPKNLFSVISKDYKDSLDWTKIKIFWGDERCVNPTDEQSNYFMAYNYLIKHLNIPKENLFRIRGEINPEEEVKRYSKILEKELNIVNGLPSFNLIMLGLGEDGHTASLFPNQLNLFFSDNYCVVSFHPENNQKRISITGKIINNAEEVVFLVTGKNKSEKIYEIINESKNAKDYPAYFVKPDSGKLIWLIDREAATLLDKSKVSLTI